ncbi:MAG: hypothetical protein QGM46_06230 [Actinomycetota bacterium]|nr:hypothetical protein [Actinomycetota bacterium]MDK1291932.1 hypothetical protein [Actinomycetota bacterium]
MRRFTIMLLVLATALLLAVPATAEKPDNPGKPDSEPVAGTICVSPWWDGDIKDSLGEDGLPGKDGWSDDFTIILDKNNQNACVDVLTEFAGVWIVTVQVEAGDAPRVLTIVPRDAVAPGEIRVAGRGAVALLSPSHGFCPILTTREGSL